jgi:hypothetical protein
LFMFQYIMHAHLLISSEPIFLHYTKPFSLIFPCLMSLFSTFVMFLAIIHWNFPLATLILTLTLLEFLVFPMIQID